MKAVLENLNTYNPSNNSRKTSFCGMSRVLCAQTIEAFLKKTRILGDVTILRRKGEKLIPETVSLVRSLNSKADNDSKVIYALFEKGFEKSPTLQALDRKELGLMEVKYKVLNKSAQIAVDKKDVVKYRSLAELCKRYRDGLKIDYLVCHEGDKFKGIGTRLLDVAAAFSKKLGSEGRMFLLAKNHIPKEYRKIGSQYFLSRQNNSPVPFYYKYGFRADNATNGEILKNRDLLKDAVVMYLPDSLTKQKSSSLVDIKAF